MKSNLIYHIMIDRFYPVGNKNNERKFNCGTLQGITEKLDYIKGLGMNGIMLTPFYENAKDSYHGYHIIDFKQVDSHFGTWEDVRTLISEVHKRGMFIVADFVANHCHKDCKLFKDSQHKDWFRYNKNGSIKGFADLDFLPMFNTDNKEVRKYLTNIALDLCKLGFDAIRLDHATGPTYSFWRYFKKTLKSQYPKVKIIGEVWGELDFKPKHRIRYWFNTKRYDIQEARQLEYVGVFDGILDFYYQSLLSNAVKKNKKLFDNDELNSKIVKHFKHYPEDFDLWLFLDNHDLNRFMFECNQNKIKLKEAIEYSKQWNKTFLQYYGTESYMTNTESIFDGTSYADERVRQKMKW